MRDSGGRAAGSSGRAAGGAALGVLLAAAVRIAAGAGAALAADPPPEPAGYRLSHYRAPTPARLSGALTVDTPGAWELIRSGAVVPVNVLKIERSSLPGGPWLPPPMPVQIAGSTWLANVGVGEPEPDIEAYFRHHLERLTGGDRDRGLLFYCIADCWMSYNAAKRAMAWGYTRVVWYPEGLDGWEQAGLPTEDAVPVPVHAPR